MLSLLAKLLVPHHDQASHNEHHQLHNNAVHSQGAKYSLKSNKHIGLASEGGALRKSAEPQKQYIALIGDIGGTNIRFKLISFIKSSNFPTLIKKSEAMKTAAYNSFADAVAEFLEGVSEKEWPQFAGVGMAGAVINNENIVTNAPHWPKIIGNDLAKQFNMKRFQLYNDFEIASYACLNLDETQVVQINNAVGMPNKIKTVCGPGTGLGVSIIVPHQRSPGSDEYIYQVWPGEGGHCAFAAINQIQNEFHQFLLKYYKDRTAIALEYSFAGPSIPFMYQFFKEKFPNAELICEENEGGHLFNLDEYLRKLHSNDPKERESAHFPSHRIMQYGVNEEDQICNEVVKLFVSIYETAIGDMAIRTLSYSGIYLVGSMTQGVLPYLLKNKDKFMKNYMNDRPYLKSIFEKIPIYVVRSNEIGLDGAFVVTKQMAINSE